MNKPKSKFKLPKTTLQETQNIKKNLKPSNATGHDLSSIKIYKKLNKYISTHIMHLTNSIIDNRKYPQILNISMMTPTRQGPSGP